MDNVLRVSDLTFHYNKGNDVLRGVTMSVKAGEKIGILGPNGSGKTTFVKILSGVLRNFTGEVLLKGKELKKYSYKELSRILAVVPQNFNIAMDYRVEDIILMGRYPYSKIFGGFTKTDYEILEKVIEEMDLKPLRNKNFSKISGGEAQRVIVAKALAQEPEILILDEFAAHLDLNHKKNLVDIINSIPDITLIGIYHDVNLCTSMVDKIFFLKNGKILYNGDLNEMITYDKIKAVYNVNVQIYIDNNGKRKIFI